MKAKYSKKVQIKKCPWKNTIIIIGSGKPFYWCGVFKDDKQCIFHEYVIITKIRVGNKEYKIIKEDAGECSYYLFAEEIWAIRILDILSKLINRGIEK